MRESANFPSGKEIPPKKQEKILMAADRLYEEYLEKINQEKMTADQAMDDVEKKCKDGEIVEELKEEVIKKLMLLAE
jgi:hypothetical protein